MVRDGMSRDGIPARLLNAKRSAAQSFLRARQPSPFISAFAASARPQHNVVGIGIGSKMSDDMPTGQPAVRIYVERKLPRSVIPPSFLLPETVGGVPTDVIETGRFRALPARIPVARRRLRPAQPGSSVGFHFTGDMAGFVMAGTFGAVVEDSSGRYILSNNHVLANENQLATGSSIFQPGLLDEGNPETDQIARLTRFIALDTIQDNEVDCAIAQVLEPRSVRATFLRRVGRLKSRDPITAVEGMAVHKVGRTTGYTTGTVFDVSADVIVGYESGNIIFQNQVLVRGDRKPFSDSGDSGSVIVDRATKRPTALLFAGSSTHTIGNHMANVLGQLGVTMVI